MSGEFSGYASSLLQLKEITERNPSESGKQLKLRPVATKQSNIQHTKQHFDINHIIGIAEEKTYYFLSISQISYTCSPQVQVISSAIFASQAPLR